MKTAKYLSVLTIALTALTAHGLAQDAISVQFQGQGAALTAGQTAGVDPRANYNVATGTSGSGIALKNNAGGLTGVTLSFSATDIYGTGTGSGNANRTLLSGKIGPAYGGSDGFTLTGLGTGVYDLIVYTENDQSNQPSTASSSGQSYSISDQAGSAFDGSTFIRGTNTTATPAAAEASTANYVEFDDIQAIGGTLSFTSSQLVASGVGGGDFNGFQLIEAPEPSSVALLLGGLGAFALLLRFRKIA